jgi:alpha-galactosidase
MNRILRVVLVFMLPFIGLQAAERDAAATNDRDALNGFIGARIDRPAAPPFSFLYGGRPSAGFIGKWKTAVETQTAADKAQKKVVYSDTTTNLRVTVVYTIYKDYSAVEWALHFKNEGTADTPLIENVLACSTQFDNLPKGPLVIYRARGSSAERSDFAPLQDSLAEKGEVRFGPSGGRSSDTTALPFFNVAAEGRGIMAAVGWSGRWTASLRRGGGGGLALDTGMEKTRFKLHPGEEVRSPSIALLFWKGSDRLAGHNLFRRFVLAHHTPQTNGKPVEMPLSHGVGFGGPFPCNEYVCATESYALAMIDRLRQFGIEPDACWIDAGWYENAGRSWWQGVGNWTVNRANFPRGLKPVTEAAKSWGKGFVVWFEPERVYEGTRLDREHPEWLAKLPGNPNRLLNLGDPRALQWLTDHISNFIKTEGITIYRQDFNFDPAPYWQSMDAPERTGFAEMKHIEGLYAYWDALLARNPGLFIDNCASGGRRIDLETIGRSVPLWRTDYSYFEPNGYQCHTYGLQLYLPCSGTGNNNPQKYYFRSSMNGAVVLGWELNGTYNNASFNTSLAREDIAEFRALRPYFYGDFYPLTEYSTSDETWMAFQWDRPEERDGIVLAFRRPLALSASISITPHELDPAGDYEVAFEDYGITLIKSGRELLAGIPIKIPEAPGSLLIKYRRVR